MQLLVVRRPTDQRRSDREKSNQGRKRAGRICWLCGRGGTAALKSASLVVRHSAAAAATSSVFAVNVVRSRRRPELRSRGVRRAEGKGNRRGSAGIERAGTGFDVNRTPAAAAAAPPSPRPVRFILLPSRCLSSFFRVDHRAPPNPGRKSSKHRVHDVPRRTGMPPPPCSACRRLRQGSI